MEDVEYIVNKIIHLRVFEDENQKMNLSLKNVDGSILSISQFTLYGDTRKGRRPSFIKAAKPEHAKTLYEAFNQKIERQEINMEIGQLSAMMDLQFTNESLVSLIIDSND